MRKSLFYLAFLLVGCGGSGGADVTGPVTQRPPVSIPHFPEIIDLALSPDTVTHMHDDGNVVVTAEITFADTGLDIQTLWVRMPDGTSIEFDESFDTETGTFSEQVTMSTDRIGAFTLEFWLVDKAGDSSIHHFADFSVTGDVQSSDWTLRLSGLPHDLNDVIWDGTVFVAVGDGGTVLTSADGIDWIARESGTDASLNAVAAHGQDVFAVGGDIVLLSTDHGENWVVKHSADMGLEVFLKAVVVNSSQVIAFGYVAPMLIVVPQIVISEDRGDTWQTLDPAFGPVADVIYHDGLFVATHYSAFYYTSGGVALVSVSSDGKSWNPIILKTLFNYERGGLHVVVHDGRQFIVGGEDGSVFASFDGFNWEERRTPVKDVDYLGGAWNGSKLVLAGGYEPYSRYIAPQYEIPVGISSTDGGVAWNIFNIDGEYRSYGLAFGNGRFVSVGRTTPDSNESAIYTAE